MNKMQPKCSDLNYTCDMKPILTSNIRDIKETKRVPATGPDAREGDCWEVPTGRILGQEKVFNAYYECTHCRHREFVGTKTVKVNETVTFEEILEEKKKQTEFNKGLEELRKRQAQEIYEYTMMNSPRGR